MNSYFIEHGLIEHDTESKFDCDRENLLATWDLFPRTPNYYQVDKDNFHWDGDYGRTFSAFEFTEGYDRYSPVFTDYLKSRSIRMLGLEKFQVSQRMISDIISTPINVLFFDGSKLEAGVLRFLLYDQTRITSLHFFKFKFNRAFWFNNSVSQLPSSVTSLSLTGCKIRLKQIKLLVENKSLPLQTLDLSENSFGDPGAKILGSHPIQNLNLRKCRIGADGAKSFTNNKILKKLNLKGNPIGSQGLYALLSHPTLTDIIVSDCKINSAELINLPVNPVLKSLDLSGNFLEDRLLDKLSTSCSNLTQINILFCRTLSSTGIDFILKLHLQVLILSLLTDKTIISLSKHNFITDLNLIGCQTRAEWLGPLSNNSHLKKLCLPKNFKLGEEEAKHLANFSALTDLTLFKSEMNDKGIAILAQKSGLQILNLYNPNINLDWSLIPLALNPSIRKLTLPGEKINILYALFFIGNQVLEHLSLHNNNMPIAKIAACLFTRNCPKNKEDYDAKLNAIFSDNLPLPTVLTGIVKDYSDRYSYRYGLFRSILTLDHKQQWDALLPQIKKNIPEMKDIVSPYLQDQVAYLITLLTPFVNKKSGKCIDLCNDRYLDIKLGVKSSGMPYLEYDSVIIQFNAGMNTLEVYDEYTRARWDISKPDRANETIILFSETIQTSLKVPITDFLREFTDLPNQFVI